MEQSALVEVKAHLLGIVAVIDRELKAAKIREPLPFKFDQVKALAGQAGSQTTTKY